MNKEKLKNKRVLLAPYNNQSIEFADYLTEVLEAKFVGFLDRQKKGSLVFSYNHSIVYEADYIIILSPKFGNEITKNLDELKVNKNRIYYAFAQKDGESFNFYKSVRKYQLAIKIRYFIQKINCFMNISYLDLYLLKNKHKGKRAFIIGNGPSLRIEDLNKLKNEITFAANKIYLAFDQTNWRPNYYFVVDKLVYKQNYKKIKELPLRKFFSIDMVEISPKIKKSCYFPLANETTTPTLCANPFLGMNKGNTVVYVMAEFAIYMGIKEIYLIGVDFDFEIDEDSKKKHFGPLKSNGEKNHFHKEYRKVGEKWNRPNMQGIKRSFEVLHQYCLEHDIKIYNATRGGKLEVFKRVEFDTLFNKKSYM